MTMFFRLLDVSPDGKSTALRDAVASGASTLESDARTFNRDASTFANVPGVAMLYWLPDSILKLYGTYDSWANFETRCGLGTLDDFQFLRCWWELAENTKNWHPFAKGGAYSPWYSDTPLAIGWDNNARGLKASVEQKVGSASRKIQGEDHYFLPGITWPRRPHNLGSFQVLGRDAIFSDNGPAMFGPKGDELFFVVAVLNSAPYLFLLDSLMPRGSEGGQTLTYENGFITAVPLPAAQPSVRARLAVLAQQGWSSARALQSKNETARAFLLPSSLWKVVDAGNSSSLQRDLLDIQAQVDDAVFDLYSIRGRDRELIESWIERRRSHLVDSDEGDQDRDAVQLKSDVLTLISWLVGVSFGRFDWRLTTDQRVRPREPDPFSPLPSRSPGMWPKEQEEVAQRTDIFVDDEGHAEDLLVSVRLASEKAGVSVAEDLRTWLQREFFALHIKMYSRSRRKAPIYWQLSTSSASYSVWLYIHAFTKDTLFRVQNDYVVPKLAHEERRLETLIRELGDNANPAQRKELVVQESFVEELRGFLEDVKHVAPLWNPYLDDGVIINAAPLWRLFPQHKAWQKEVRATWESLCIGDCDWAHLAMHLWPDRVVTKCATDRSLAIAHGLEEVFWIEGDGGKWKRRQTPLRPISVLVAERSSEAVKAALKSVIEAPDPTGSTKRGRKSKAA